jgi:Zn-dependent protease with chaperone function
MARVEPLDFREFVRERINRQPGGVDGDTHGYAYVADRRTRAVFEHAKPIELAVAAAVRLFQELGRAQLLGQAVKVGPQQFPRVHSLSEHCAATLGITTPTLYIVNHPQLNAATYGTNEDSFILLHSALVDHMSDEELKMVIGHECGHIHNSHVVYLTALHYLGNMAGLVVRWAALPGMLALKAWSRRAEITSDRAGALCTGDLDVSVRTITKLALGSQKLYDELNIEAFLEQHSEAQRSAGRFGEVLANHPWLPKRVLALRAFADSALFRRRAGLGETGTSMAQVDQRVQEIVKVVA